MSHHRQLRCKAFNVFRFLLQKAHRDEEGEVSVLVSGGLETPIEIITDGFPEFIAIGLDDHAAAHWRVIREISLQYNVVVPLRKILAHRCDHKSPFLSVEPESK